MVMEQAGNGADSDALVFVYGSLKRGMANHEQLQGAAWVGEASITGLALYDLGPFPMAVADDQASTPLQGELYRVSAQLLQKLDRFEGAPRLYERQWRRLRDGCSAWVYVGRKRQVCHAALIASGCWQGVEPPVRRGVQPQASDPSPPPTPPNPTH
jgi:gamma-glutamylcyclotransferase (GGCT)/AIG2-like uncharacterized protein YtfP